MLGPLQNLDSLALVPLSYANKIWQKEEEKTRDPTSRKKVVIPILDCKPIFEWCAVRCGSKKRQHQSHV